MIREDQYGTVMTNCSTITGEIFNLKKGQKILIYRIDKGKQLAECSYKGYVGWVEMKNIAIVPKVSNKVETLSTTTSSVYS